MKVNSRTCSFKTPMLAKGETYYYELRVETTRNGKSVSETKKVTVRAGEEITTTFTIKDTSLVAKAK